ncbi:MAG: hypothetical protein ACTSSI_17595 [Candidatus Helarchaeota archaeon]
MLQQTDYGHVRKVWTNFFKEFPDIQSINEASETRIKAILRPLGLWQQRTAQIKKISNEIVTKYGGVIPDTYERLIELTGIGDYIARATLCFAFNQPTYILDVNTKKIVIRYFLFGTAFKNALIKEILEEITPKEPNDCKIFNWGLIDFSSKICSRKPKCKKCQLRFFCQFHKVEKRK